MSRERFIAGVCSPGGYSGDLHSSDGHSWAPPPLLTDISNGSTGLLHLHNLLNTHMYTLKRSLLLEETDLLLVAEWQVPKSLPTLWESKQQNSRSPICVLSSPQLELVLPCDPSRGDLSRNASREAQVQGQGTN